MNKPDPKIMKVVKELERSIIADNEVNRPLNDLVNQLTDKDIHRVCIILLNHLRPPPHMQYQCRCFKEVSEMLVFNMLGVMSEENIRNDMKRKEE